MAMDITNAAAAAITTPYSGADTPPNNKPMGFLAYANGALKRQYPTAPPPMAEPPPAVAVSYKECMRNHAASIGGHALDGCCEFMPSPMFNASDPTSLRCAACGCHRNFHRRDPDDPAPLQLHRQSKSPPNRPPPADSPSSPPTPATFSSAPHMLMALRKCQSGMNPATANGRGKSSSSSAGGGKKRFRTKFSQDQKEKMYDFAARLGWKMQRIEKSAVEEFCDEIGVGKDVLKVWMHNNKNTLGRKEIVSSIENGGNGGAGGNNNGGGGVRLVSGNGSSSSSD